MSKNSSKKSDTTERKNRPSMIGVDKDIYASVQKHCSGKMTIKAFTEAVIRKGIKDKLVIEELLQRE